MTFAYRLSVTPGWSIPDMGVFLAEWESPTALIVAIESDTEPGLNFPGIVGIAPVGLDEAFDFIKPLDSSPLSWTS